MTQQENMDDLSWANTVPLDVSGFSIHQQILRIRRIGKRLFGVSNCFVSIADYMAGSAEPERSMASIEAAFVDGLTVPQALYVANDTRIDPSLRQHRLVVGAPYIRFYAAQPITDAQNQIIGSVCLVDYAPRTFNPDDGLLLADLAILFERELRLNSASATQLDLIKKNRNLRRESLTDPLVGTWNRAAITRALSTEMVNCAQVQKSLSMVLVDLDHFRNINEEHGRPSGDILLLKVVSRLRSCIRPHDALGRYDGDQFMVVLPGASHLVSLAVAERMRLSIMAHTEVVGAVKHQLTVSAGTVSTDTFPAATAEELIDHAEKALGAAKKAGRNRVAQAHPGELLSS
ncbi:MAG: sensor domain-containing diguanylate cyclase [Glaciimonas sp.]|nr:sensor domain-containing diguanylate cyclase [Glaciimonas sp.]